MQYLVLSLALIIFCACQNQVVSDARPARAPVIFVHGFKGARLIDQEGSTVWLNSWQALAFSNPPLALPLRWNSEQEQARDGITAAGVLDKVKIIPHLIEAQVYGSFLEGMPQPFYPFYYDWRRDNLESLELLKVFVEKVHTQHPGQKIVLVAHSMGGLLSWPVLNLHPDWFSSTFFAGVPFAGTVSFVPDMLEPASNGLNSKILSPEVLGSFPSIYSLLPSSDAKDSELFQIEFWISHKMGIFHSGEVSEAKRTGLRNSLARALAFRNLLSLKADHLPPLHTIISTNFPTLDQVKFQEDGSLDLRARTCPGDKRICARSAKLPFGLAGVNHATDAEHGDLLNSKDIISVINSAR